MYSSPFSKLEEMPKEKNANEKKILKCNKNGRMITFTSGWMVRPKGKITNNTPLAN